MARPSDTENTRKIPRDEWERFLNDFTGVNQETTARVELVRSPEIGFQILTEGRPLIDVTLDAEAAGEQVIIECGDTAGETPAAFRHIVADPTAIWARSTGPSAWDALEIEARDGSKVVVTINPHPGRGDLNLEAIGRSQTGAS